MGSHRNLGAAGLGAPFLINPGKTEEATKSVAFRGHACLFLGEQHQTFTSHLGSQIRELLREFP